MSGRHWIWLFGEIEGLRWVLEHRTMAFPATAESRASKVGVADQAILYLSRGAFHNPTRDVSRLGGIVEATGPVHSFDPIPIAGREFALVCTIEPLILLPEREGPEARPLIQRLSFVKRPDAWGAYLRSSPVGVSADDFHALAEAIHAWQSGPSPP